MTISTVLIYKSDKRVCECSRTTVAVVVKKKLCVRLIITLLPCIDFTLYKKYQKASSQTQTQIRLFTSQILWQKIQYQAKSTMPLWGRLWKSGGLFLCKDPNLGLGCCESSGKMRDDGNKNQTKSQSLRLRLIRLFLLEMKTPFYGFNKIVHV